MKAKYYPDKYKVQQSGHTFDRRFFDWYAKQRSEAEEKEYRNKMEIKMETGKIFPYGQIGKLPIFGPPTLQQIWGTQDFGKDWQMRGTGRNPLTKRESNLLKSELMKDISIEKNLGMGNFGSVWKVKALYRSTQHEKWSEKNGTPDYQYFAMKVLRHSGKYATLKTLGDRMYFSLEVLLNEMYSLRYLKHQNICKILDMIAIPDHLTGFPYSVVCLFMELCDGDLSSLLLEGRRIKPQLCPNGAQPEHLCKHWFRDALKGLKYIHKNGVVHCDMFSGNILYLYQRVRGQPVDLTNVPYEQKVLNSIFKLGDFGISHTEEYFKYPDKGKPDIANFSRRYGKRNFPREMWIDCYELLDILIHEILPVGAKTKSVAYKYPQHWKQFSKEFRDFFFKYGDRCPRNMSAAGILNEPWLAGKDPIRDKERDRKDKESEDPSPEVKKVRRLKCPHCGFIVKRSANPDSV